MTRSRQFQETVNSTSADESPLLCLEISHPDLAEPIRVVNDNDDFPYGYANEWLPSHIYTAGQIVVPPAVEGEPGYNGRYYECVTGGTTGASAPVWPSVINDQVADGTATWKCAGNQFKAMGFRVKKPDDMENQMPQARLAVDNVGRELVGWLEQTGGGRGATCRMMEVLRSDPSIIEWEVTLDLTNIEITTPEVAGTLGWEDLLNRPGVPMTYRPDTSPGLF